MSIWTDKNDKQWDKLSSSAAIFVEKISGRDDLFVSIEPDLRDEKDIEENPMPAGVFFPTQAKIVVDASQVFDASTTPSVAHVDPNGFFSQRLFPRLTGTLVHESAHAKHSTWILPENVTSRVNYWVTLLEEIRIEKQILERFPQYSNHLRTILTEIVHSSLSRGAGSDEIYDRYAAAHAGILVCGRNTLEIISDEQVADVKTKCLNILGSKTYTQLEELWTEALDVEDDAPELLVGIAEKISELIDEKQEVPNEVFSDMVRLPCGAFPAGSSEQDGSRNQPKDTNGTFISDIQTIQDEPLEKKESSTPPPPSRKELDIKRREDISDAKSTIQPPSTGSRGYSMYSYRKPVLSTTKPTSVDVGRMRSVMKSITEAQYRAVTKTLHASDTPPGRLQIREIMNHEAQIASRQTLTAKPWKQTRRREVDNPPLTLGVATDISGSMNAWQREVSSFTWAVASAVKKLSGKVGAVAWDTETYHLIEPNKAYTDLGTYTCNGGSSGCAPALKALDGLMSLSYSEGVRIAVVITDGILGRTEASIQKEIDELDRNGVKVVWLLTQANGFKPKKAQIGVLKSPSDFGKIVGNIIVKALEEA